MKFVNSLVVAICATVAYASPTPSDLGDGITLTPRRSGVERRRANGLPNLANVTEHLTLGNVGPHIVYNTNWAGAVLIGSNYKTITGTFNVPTPKVPSGGSSSTEYIVSAWVGIDGDTCRSAIWQAGVDAFLQNGRVTYGTWYEWYPEDSYYYSGFTVSAGDSIKVTLTVTSPTSGTVNIQNLSTGQSVSHTLSGLPSSEKLCQTNAEWIVEALEPVQNFASFGTITFKDASVTNTAGNKVGPSGSEIFAIEQNNKVHTDCSASSSTVTCKYM